MDLKAIIEWIGHNSGYLLAFGYPYLAAALAVAYVLWLVLGYLRVSQVGLPVVDESAGPVLPLPAAAEGSMARPRGVPYCPTDRLQFPVEARYCPRCEGDLLVDCSNCGTTIRAADESCYRCGTRHPLAAEDDEF
jgi:hypothetical protein